MPILSCVLGGGTKQAELLVQRSSGCSHFRRFDVLMERASLGAPHGTTPVADDHTVVASAYAAHPRGYAATKATRLGYARTNVVVGSIRSWNDYGVSGVRPYAWWFARTVSGFRLNL